MNAMQLLTQCRTLGIELSPHGKRLHVDAPKGVVTPELREELQAHKAELLTALRLEEAAKVEGVRVYIRALAGEWNWPQVRLPLVVGGNKGAWERLIAHAPLECLLAAMREFERMLNGETTP